MIERLIRTALEQRVIVLCAVIGLIVGGVAAFRHLPIDAFPDVTPVQVQVITRAPSLAPPEIERLVTFPLEIELTNLPGKTELRSVSRFGISVITVVFADKVDVYFARQLVLERMLQARSRLPQHAEPVLGPVSTGLSEVFMYLVEGSTQSLMDLRTLQDWVIRPMLRAVSGLADVDTLGGLAKQYEVLVDPNRLTSFGLTLRQVHALSANLMSLGGLAISLGMIVDAAIVQVENVERHLGEETKGRALSIADRLPVVLRAVLEVRRPSLFGELIIALTFVPLLTLQGIEGKMFIPLALTLRASMKNVLAVAEAMLLGTPYERCIRFSESTRTGTVHGRDASVWPNRSKEMSERTTIRMTPSRAKLAA